MIRPLLLCCLLGLLISGCGFKDIDKRFFVLAIGVDSSGNPDKPYRVSLKLGIASPRIEPGETNKYQLVTQDASTITEAVRLLKSKVDKELDFGHAKIIVFGDTLAREDVSRPLDWFMRRRDIQKVGYVAVGEPSAQEVLAARPLSERLPANSLFLSFDQEGTESSYIMTENLSDFYRRMTERGLDPYLPVIKPLKDTYEIDRVALLDKNKIITILNPDQTRMLNELVRQFRKIEIHTELDHDTFDIAINALKVKYKLSQAEGKGEPTININLAMKGMVEESTRPIFEEDWNKLQKIVNQQTKDRFLEVLTLLREKQVDPVGFGLRYRAMGYVSDEDWERWIQMYPNVDFQFQAKTVILGSGTIK